MALVILGAVVVNGTYVLRRLIVVIPTLVIITAFTFWLQNGRGNRHDLAFNILGPGATDSGVAQIVKEFHLDQPLWRRYLLWLSGAVHGDLGKSAIQGQQVSTAIAKALPVTLQLMLYAQILALVLAIPAGVYAVVPGQQARRPDRQHRRPGLLLDPQLRPGRRPHPVPVTRRCRLPATRSAGRCCRRPLRPVRGESCQPLQEHGCCLRSRSASGWRPATCGCLRSDMIATLQENFITTAKAKGVPDRRILFAHALRPSSFTLLTIVGLQQRHAHRRCAHHRDDLLAAGPRHGVRHGDLPEGLPRRPGHHRRHRRGLHPDQLPVDILYAASGPEGAPCPCLTSTKQTRLGQLPRAELARRDRSRYRKRRLGFAFWASVVWLGLLVLVCGVRQAPAAQGPEQDVRRRRPPRTVGRALVRCRQHRPRRVRPHDLRGTPLVAHLDAGDGDRNDHRWRHRSRRRASTDEGSTRRSRRIVTILLSIPGLVLLLALVSFLAPPDKSSPRQADVLGDRRAVDPGASRSSRSSPAARRWCGPTVTSSWPRARSGPVASG